MTSETPFPQAYSEELRSLLLMCEVVGYTVVWTDPTWHVMQMPGNVSGYMEASNNVHGAALLSRHLEAKNGDATRYSFGWTDKAAVYSHIFEAAPGAPGAVYTVTAIPPQAPSSRLLDIADNFKQYLLGKI